MNAMLTSGIAACALACAPLAAAAQAGGELEARIERIESRQAIQELLREYGRLLDSRDLDAWAALFAEDGEWIGGLGSHKGRAAVREMVDVMPPNPDGRLTGFHVMSNAIIEIAEDGQSAAAESRWAFYDEGEEGRPRMVMGGRYIDDLVVEDGEWKFARRVAYGDIPFDDPLAGD